MVSRGPYSSKGWDDLLKDDDNEVWREAFETNEDGSIDMDRYDEFGNIQELVNFVLGQGSYDKSDSFIPTESDRDMRKREMHNDQWKVPGKLSDLKHYLSQGNPYSDVNIDPAAEKGWNISERESRKRGYDTKYTAHFMAYDPDDDREGGAAFYMAFSWYDDDPKSFNLEEKVDIDIDSLLEEDEE